MKQRKLRKSDLALPLDETEEILEGGKTGLLGLNGLDGYPYVVPVNYALADNRIIIHSAAKGYAQDCISADSRASFTVFNIFEIQETTTNYESAMYFGKVEIVTAKEQKAAFMKQIASKFKGQPVDQLPPGIIDRITVIILTPEEFSGKRKQGLTHKKPHLI